MTRRVDVAGGVSVVTRPQAVLLRKGWCPMGIQRRFGILAVLLGPCCALSCSADDPQPVKTVYVPAVAVKGAGAAQLRWPRTFEDAGRRFAIYQPQIDTWEGNNLVARSAVAVTPAGAKDPRLGVIVFEAHTDVDKPARVVTLNDVRVTKVSFPQAKAEEASYLQMIRRHLTDKTRVVPLDQLEANLAASENARAAAGLQVKNDPPRIIFATTPTLLVLIDGEPTLREVTDPAGARLMRVANTRALILFDPGTNQYFLRAMGKWAAAPSHQGPWAVAAEFPSAVEWIRASLKDDKSVDLFEPTDPQTAPKDMPAVLTSTTPAELIQTLGEPAYTPVPGANLAYASNTDAALFKDLTTQKVYVLISGRWFASDSTNGPWAYVPGKQLPADFMKIPADGPKANVLVSVPGTPQAREAAIANSIPQTAAVKISATKLTVTYDGRPQFKPIEGVKGLTYATNTTLPVIFIEGDKTYWCVENGVWFASQSPTGPWAVATSVPGIIYTIPVSSPIHYVTYVKIYGTGEDVVYVGYTPGYMGTVVSGDGVVVYGTGYYYPAYVGTVYVGYPPTYGYGAGFAYGSASGFAFGFTAGVAIGGCWGNPYWGPYYGHGYGYNHIDINSSNVYHNRRGGTTYTNRHYEYDPWENKAKASGNFSSFNPYTNRTTTGGYKGKIDYDNNEYSMKRGGATYDADTGIARAAGSKVTGDLDEGTQTVTRGRASYNENTGVVKGGGSQVHTDLDNPGKNEIETGKFRYNTNTDTGIAKKGDDLYVGKDDNVYRRTDEGWQQQTNDGWQDVERDPSKSQQTRNLDQQRQSRQTGNQRVSSYERAGAYQSGGSGRSTGGAYAGTSNRSSAGRSYSGSSGRSYGGSGGAYRGGGGARGGGGRGGGRR
jgi:hypothetical protein